MSEIAKRAEGRKDKQQRDKDRAVLTYLTAKISTDRFSSDLMLKQMDHSDA